MVASSIRETDLYAPIKQLLEGQGYVVKAEVGAADVVACRGDEDPVVVELKTGFSLSLFHQAVERQRMTESVYVAVPRGTGRAFARTLRANIGLCRRLGLGLMTVRLTDGLAQVHADPAPYRPRQSARRKGLLLKEFAERAGDPNLGGQTRAGLVTAYRQDALRCLLVLSRDGATRASAVARLAGVGRARAIMADNHYAWFERVERGVYGLTPAGEQARQTHGQELARLTGFEPGVRTRRA